MLTVIPDLYPMGGKSDEKRLEKGIMKDSGWIAERKFDGARYLIRKELDGSVHVTSRQKSKKTNRPVDKTGNVPHLVEMMKNVPNGTILDGEIITHINCTSSEVTEIMGCDAEKALKRQAERGNVIFVAYDVLYVKGASVMGLAWEIRRKYLEDICQNFIGIENKYLILSTYLDCGENDIEAWYNEIVENGGEGIMLKNKKSTYEPDKKPVNSWIKVKKWITADCVIMGYSPAEVEYKGKELETWQYWQDETGGKYMFDGEQHARAWESESKTRKLIPITQFHYLGWIGAVRFGQIKDGKMIEVGQCSGMTFEVRKLLTENKTDYLGEVIEVKAMERIKKTLSLRHPEFHCFRPDKNPKDCLIGEV